MAADLNMHMSQEQCTVSVHILHAIGFQQLLSMVLNVLQILQDPTIKDSESPAMRPETDVQADPPTVQQLPQQLPESVQEVVRLHSLDSINALMWPQSRRVSSAGSKSSRSSGHLHLYVDHASDRLHLYVDQPQLQQVLPPQPLTFPRLRSTASINALVWPASRPASSKSSGSQAEAAEDVEEVRSSRDATAATAVAVIKPLPSASSIDALLWPGDEAVEQQHTVSAEHAEHAVLKKVRTFCGLPVRMAAEGTADAPFRTSAVATGTFRAQKQQSLLDRAAAKRALAALLAAAKASEIRGWSPKQRALSPAPSDHAEPAVPAGHVLPSLEDIEALVPMKASR